MSEIKKPFYKKVQKEQFHTKKSSSERSLAQQVNTYHERDFVSFKALETASTLEKMPQMRENIAIARKEEAMLTKEQPIILNTELSYEGPVAKLTVSLNSELSIEYPGRKAKNYTKLSADRFLDFVANRKGYTGFPKDCVHSVGLWNELFFNAERSTKGKMSAKEIKFRKNLKTLAIPVEEWIKLFCEFSCQSESIIPKDSHDSELQFLYSCKNKLLKEAGLTLKQISKENRTDIVQLSIDKFSTETLSISFRTKTRSLSGEQESVEMPNRNQSLYENSACYQDPIEANLLIKRNNAQEISVESSFTNQNDEYPGEGFISYRAGSLVQSNDYMVENLMDEAVSGNPNPPNNSLFQEKSAEEPYIETGNFTFTSDLLPVVSLDPEMTLKFLRMLNEDKARESMSQKVQSEKNVDEWILRPFEQALDNQLDYEKHSSEPQQQEMNFFDLQ